MIELLSSPETWVSFVTLAVLEIVLGIDNIIFISIVSGRLPEAQRARARQLGLAGAFLSRIGLLAALSWILKLDRPWFELAGRAVSGKSLILLLGGVFLVYKATKEIHHKVEAANVDEAAPRAAISFAGVIAQIMLLDAVFSIDSVITAVGMTDQIAIMIAANVVALVVMLAVGGPVGQFVERHPSVKVLALAFLLMIGFVLLAEGLGFHIPKGYIYGAMGFSVFVELINLKSSRKQPRRLGS